MTSIDVNQARKYIELLRGNSDATVCWQLFSDSDPDNTFPINFDGSLSLTINELTKYQNKGFGVFVTINPTDGQGRKIENITSYDWAFADIDGKAIPNDFPLLPAFTTRRDATHGHIYWPIEECLTVSHYGALQKRIALYLDSDEQVTDVARVARVPGLWHLKNPQSPAQYYIHDDNSHIVDFAYGADEIEAAFELSPEKEQLLNDWVQNRGSHDSGTGLNDNPIYRQQFLDFITTIAPIAMQEGTGRSHTAYKVACFGFDRGLHYHEAQELMWEYYNPRCEPPWPENEKSNFYSYVKHAWDHAKNAPGCKTATAAFSGMPAPEPVGGWDTNAKLNKPKKVDETPVVGHVEITGDIAFITPEEAAVNRTVITNKASVFDHAIKFLGENYPCKTLIRFDNVFYTYNGIHWEETPEAAILFEINRALAGWKFPPSKINNILKMLEMLTYESKLEKGVYLNDRTKFGRNSVIMQNGIVEIDKGNITLKPHTRNLFDLNALTYDYDPNATCPEFLKFIDSQWPGDHQMHDQLQELYGLTLISDNRWHLLPIMIGKSRSGKGVHAQIMTKMVGAHNVCSPHLESLIEDHTMNTMSTKKLAIIPEANALHPAIRDRVLNRLKSIASNDSIQFNRKYKDGANCSIWPLTIIQSNELPDFQDGSNAFGNRVWPFHFTRSFAGVEDRYLADRLCAPESIAGIFTWALKGLVRIIENGKQTTAASSQEMIDEIKYDTFVLSPFIDDFCVIDPDSCVYVDDLYDFYLIHCKSKNQKMPVSPQKFSKLLKSCHYDIHKRREGKVEDTKRRYVFTGIAMNQLMVQKHKPTMPPAGVEPIRKIQP